MITPRATAATAALSLLIALSIALCSGQASYEPVTLKDFTVPSYQSFISKVRNQIPTSRSIDSIKVLKPLDALKKDDGGKKRFVYFILENGSAKVTFALDSSDLYVHAYKVGSESWFFKGIPADAKSKIFTDTKQADMTFEGSYTDLERLVGSRREIRLDVKTLGQAAVSLAKGKSVDASERSKMLMVVIQMVSEAARFQYILREMSNNGVDGQRPSAQMLQYENSWNKDEVRGEILKVGNGGPKTDRYRTLLKDVYLIKP